jgi:GNAT superfamily N-acetyltransferase
VPNPQLRLRETDDLEAIQHLHSRTFGKLWVPLESSVWWLLEVRQDGEWAPVGFAGAELTDGGQYGYLSRAGVLPEARGLQLQRRLIRVRERWARAAGCTHIWTYTSVENIRSMRSLIACGLLPYMSDGMWMYWKKALDK